MIRVAVRMGVWRGITARKRLRVCVGSEGLIDLKKLLVDRSRTKTRGMAHAPYMHLIRIPNAVRKQRKSSDRRPPFHWTQLKRLATGDRPMEGSAQLSVTQPRSPPNPSTGDEPASAMYTLPHCGYLSPLHPYPQLGT
jgi:hypothetical protein